MALLLAAGIASVLGVLALSNSAPGPESTSWPVVALLWTVAAASQVVPLRFHHRGGVQGFHLQTGVLVALLLLVPAPVAVAAIVSAGMVVFALRRTETVKLLFNLGQDLVWASAAAVVFLVLAGPGDPLELRGLVAGLVALLVAEVVNATLLGELFRRLDDRPLMDTVADVLGPTGLVGIMGNASAAVFLSLLADRSPWLIVLALPSLAGTFLGYRGYVRESGERSRAEALQATSRLLVEAGADPSRLGDAVDGLRDLFSAGSVALATRAVDAPLPALVPVAQRVLSDGRPVLQETPAAIAAPVVLDGRVVAAVVVGGRRGVSPWGPADLALLGTIAEEVGAALRTRELMTSLERERQRMEVESKKLADIVNAASDGILLVDTDGLVRSFNPAMQTLTGRPVDEVLGRPWWEVLTLRDEQEVPVRPGAQGPLPDVLSGRARAEAIAGQVQRSDGDWRWVRWSGAPVLDDDDQVSGVVLVVQDRTKEREVEQLRDDFVATVSHELRTPLTPLRGFLHVLSSRGDSLQGSDVERILGAMDGQVSRLEDLIADLLVVAELPRTSAEVDVLPVRLHDAARDAVTEEAKGPLATRVVVDVDEALHADADQAGVRRVLRSLVSNGLKHTGGEVRVTAEVRGDRVVVAVVDEGAGIGLWGRDVIFQPFGRLGNHLHRTQGPGLGLAIARAVAESMGGTLDLVDSPYRGACFELDLPASSPVRRERARPRAVDDPTGPDQDGPSRDMLG